MSAFKLAPLQLEQHRPGGACLIEASAGTGKTYTIAALYLLLVVEVGLTVEQILVVTFTNAATAELRDRIRRRLIEARDAFAAGASAEPFLAALLQRASDRRLAQRRLEQAIVDFDQAAIFTIHGFCQRALTEHAFESGMPFDAELVSDQEPLLQEVLDDFWRREVSAGEPRLVRCLLQRKLTPEKLLRELKPWLGKPYLQLRAPAPVGRSLQELEEAVLQAWQAAADCWREEQDEVRRLLETHPGVNRKSYSKRHLPKWLAELASYLGTPPQQPEPCENLHRFTSRELAAKAGGKEPPWHPLFDACQALLDACNAYKSALEVELARFLLRALETLWRELPVLKRRRGVLGFDDLLSSLQQALTAPGSGEVLATKLRQTYRAALIDEFQDTDPLQWDIFQRLFADGERPFYLVGDPKQAIYSFRGADIYAYLAAKRAMPMGYTLGVNWRSDPPLIAAVNALFVCAKRPFLLDAIEFLPVQPRPADQVGPGLVEDGAPLAPLRFWCLGREHYPPNAKDDQLGKEAAMRQVASAVAAEIARLLQAGDAGRARIGERPLEGGDIAVLVRKHQQGTAIIKALQERGIACVQLSRDKVFASPEALELERLLSAVLEPGRESLLRAALATACLGVDGNELARLNENEQDWQAILERFHDYHRLWREHGFIRFFRTMLQREGVHARLLAYVDGERRLTNLLHLGELLHVQATETGMGMEALVNWLAQQRQEPGGGDAAELRLESDERLVKVVTIHASKGLEYPIVFCPFLWEGPTRSERKLAIAFHDPEQDLQAVLDFGSDGIEEGRLLAEEEELAEELRLAYVALTRARHRCYVVWGKCNGLQASGLGWLLHGRHADERLRPLAALQAIVKQRSLEQLREDLERLAEQQPEAVLVQAMDVAEEAGALPPPPVQEQPLQARRLGRELPPPRRISSFSWLAGQVAPGAEQPDYDAESSEAVAAEADGIFAFPRGGRPGICLHGIFEQHDFADADEGRLRRLVSRQLTRHGFAAKWTDTVVAMVQDVLATPLDGAGLRLAGLPRARRIDELEFHYPIARLDGGVLADLLRAHGFLPTVALQERVGRLRFSLAQGFMKGYIDLVFEHQGRFYLADYKSNWLGATLADYAAERLDAVMAEQGYFLQYLIYAVALHRYLCHRLPDYDYERHFGGVYYLFLRGMRPELGDRSGVFYDRPPAELIAALDRYLLTGTIEEPADVV